MLNCMNQSASPAENPVDAIQPPDPASAGPESPDPEFLEILDEDGIVIGSMTREEAESANHATQNVLVFIFDSAGRVWIQLRPQAKKHYPGLWDISTCGGVKLGETPLESALREQSEEMGFTTDLQHVLTFMNVFTDETATKTRRRLSHLYIGVSDLQPELNEEVDEFKAMPHEELLAHATAQPQHYVPSFVTELEKAIAAYKARG